MTLTSEERIRIENIFNQLLYLSSNFSNSEKEEVKNEYITHGEYGFALATYAGICIENNKNPLCAKCKPLIDELSRLLETSPSVKNSKSLNQLIYK